jgi:hypothetical protein
MSDWQPISGHPKDGRPVLLADFSTRPTFFSVAQWDEREEAFFSPDGRVCYSEDIWTHWMPLPAAPDSAEVSEFRNRPASKSL